MFGVTVADITPMVLGSDVTATTTPSTSDVEGWIVTHSAIVAGVFVAKGVDPNSFAVGSTGYSYGKNAVVLRVTSQLGKATQSDFELMSEHRREAKEYMDELREYASVLGADARSSEGSVDLMVSTSSVSMQAKIARRINASGSLRTRMGRINRL